MSYKVKEIFLTLQGEGANSGRAAIFCRFSGCNLWSGREADRERAICRFCDTDFRGVDGDGGGRFRGADELAAAILSRWSGGSAAPFVVLTGGEPALQLDSLLLEALHEGGAEVAIETNGTVALPPGIDWICVSPKAGTQLRQRRGDELKVIYPQTGLDPTKLVDLDFRHHFLQPMDGPRYSESLEACLRYCFSDPRWALSLQSHKAIGIR